MDCGSYQIWLEVVKNIYKKTHKTPQNYTGKKFLLSKN